MSVLDKIRKMKQRGGGNNGNRSSLRGIYLDWQDGPNNIRLSGDFLEVKTHFIAPAPKRKDPGLCQAEAFKGDDRIPMVINCPDWDLDTEEAKDEKTCPICKLHRIASQVLDENPGPEEKKLYEKLRSDTRPRSQLKWNVLDRDNPQIKSIEGDEEKELLGYKIASVGMEAWNDIEGIFDQVKADISDPDDGIDICVVKSYDKKKGRVTYSAKAIIEGKSLKESPLTDEERALELHDLKVRCGRQTPNDKVIDALHGDFREIYELSIEEEEAEAEAAIVDPEPEAEEPEAKEPEAEEPEVDEVDGDDDDDDPFAGSSKKK